MILMTPGPGLLWEGDENPWASVDRRREEEWQVHEDLIRQGLVVEI